jgi:hypothetical protein
MEILEAYDLTGSYRAAAELAGRDHHTVARYVALRAAGQNPVARKLRARPIDEYLPRSRSWWPVRVGGCAPMWCIGESWRWDSPGVSAPSPAVARAKRQLREGQRRVFRPWLAEPGLWLQWDWGTGSMRGDDDLAVEDQSLVRHE